MAERFMAHAWKACWGSRSSGVQIPLPPPEADFIEINMGSFNINYMSKLFTILMNRITDKKL